MRLHGGLISYSVVRASFRTSAYPFGIVPIRPRRLTILLFADLLFRPYHIVVHWSILLLTEFPPRQLNHIVVPPIFIYVLLSDLNPNFPVRFFGAIDPKF